jgi:hypothetical protein
MDMPFLHPIRNISITEIPLDFQLAAENDPQKIVPCALRTAGVRLTIANYNGISDETVVPLSVTYYD